MALMCLICTLTPRRGDFEINGLAACVSFLTSGDLKMSVKNNAFIPAALLALGLVGVGGAAIAEPLLNDVQVHGLYAAEITDGSGRVIVFARMHVGEGVMVHRPVADALGSVRLYKDGSAVVALSKKTTLAADAQVVLMKAVKVTSVGDPVVSLKSKFKKIKAEKLVALAKAAALEGKRLAAVSQGWDVAGNTPEGIEYADIQARIVTVNEWSESCASIFDGLSVALVAAGVDPLTVI